VNAPATHDCPHLHGLSGTSPRPKERPKSQLIGRLAHGARRRIAAGLVTCLAFAAGNAFALTSTSTVLTSSVNPAYASQNTTLTATVTPSAATGTVTFKDGTTTLGTGTISAGKATLSKNFTTTGSHSLTAVYGGNSTYATSTSAAITQTVTAQANSTTVLASSVNPAFVSQSTTLTATVTGSSATGTVTFKDGTTTLGTGTLSAGVATFSASFSTAGSHSLTAVYGGDTGNATSTSAAVGETVNAKTATTAVLSATPNPAIPGQSVSLGATVTGSNPTGTVTFKDGTTTLGTASVASGVATLSVTFAATGSHSLTAVYAGDVGNNASTSAAVAETVSKATTTTTLVADPNPTVASGNVTLSATVAGANPTGTVTFKDGTTTLGTGTLSGGVATLVKTFSTISTRSLTAAYGGDTANGSSTSSALSLPVNKAATTVSLSSATNPSLHDNNVVLNAVVTGPGAQPTGTVQFWSGGVNGSSLGSQTLSSGQASVSAYFGGPGTFDVTAVYAGDSKNLGSTSAVLTQVTTKTTPTVTLSTDVTQVYSQRAYASTSGVSGLYNNIHLSVFAQLGQGAMLSIMDGSTLIGTTTVDVSGNGGLYVNLQPAGTRNLTANWAGSAQSNPATSNVVNINVLPGQPQLGVDFPQSVVAGSSAGLSATLYANNPTGGSPTGTVVFSEGSTQLGTGVLNSSYYASTITSFATAGTHTVTATYAGDPNNVGSSGTGSITVTQAQSQTALAVTPTPTIVGRTVNLVATVTGVNPSGTVSFRDGSTVIGTAPITAGQATFSTSYQSTGVHSLLAVYSGDANNLTSTSSTVTETVNAGVATSTVLASSINPASARQTINLTATVTGSNPTGAVTFSDGTTIIGTAPLVAGQASIATAFEGVAAHSLTATYGGDGVNAPSRAATLTETVNINNSATTVTASKNPSSPNAPVVLSALVSGGSPTGTITFYDGGNALGSTGMSGGSAALTTYFLTTGSHAVTAAYSGDTANSSSTSALLAVAVMDGLSPGPMTWAFAYDAKGNSTSRVDPNGNRVASLYDRLDRPTTLTTAPASGGAQPSVVLSYDALDHVASVQDPRSLVTTYGIDGLGNKIAQSSPDSGSESAAYDAAGNLTRSTDARGKATNYLYDALNRVTSVSYASGVATTFEYDGGTTPTPNSLGHLTKMTDESGVTTFVYDSLGRMLSKVQQVGTKTLAVTYAWGVSGGATDKLLSVTYPSGNQVNYVYDSTGRVSAVTVNPVNSNGVGTNTGAYLNLFSGITYNGDNNILGWTWADGAPYQRTYDAYGRLSTHPVGYPLGTGSAAGLTRTLTYDNAARVTGYTHSNSAGAQTAFDQGFGYDGLDRLTSQSTTSLNYGYGLDLSGNRTSRTVGGTTYANTVDPVSNRLTQAQTAGTSGVVNNAQAYDTAGNLQSDGQATYAFSDRGRMSSATVGGSTIAYLYNGFDQRVSKAGALVPTGAAYYAYDEAGHLLGEYDASLNSIAETVYLGDTPVAVLKESGLASNSTLQLTVGNVYVDHLDTPRVITRNSDEAVLWRWDGAEAFGATPPNENPSGLGIYRFNQRFPGQIFDQESGLFYNWNRYYSPSAVGRYTTPDPIGLAGGINPYAYVEDNPVDSIDPFGLQKGGARTLVDTTALRLAPDVTPSAKAGVDATRDAIKNALNAGPDPGSSLKNWFGFRNKEAEDGISRNTICLVSVCSSRGGQSFTNDRNTCNAYDPATTTCTCLKSGLLPGGAPDSGRLPGL